MNEIIAKKIEEMAVYLAKNSSSRSVPYFVYKVKEPEGIEEHIQRLEQEKSMKWFISRLDIVIKYFCCIYTSVVKGDVLKWNLKEWFV